jgi:hypothetical protein
LKAGGTPAGFVFRHFVFRHLPAPNAFIAHSRNKSFGTVDHPEHRARPAVVGAGNAIL